MLTGAIDQEGAGLNGGGGGDAAARRLQAPTLTLNAGTFKVKAKPKWNQPHMRGGTMSEGGGVDEADHRGLADVQHDYFRGCVCTQYKLIYPTRRWKVPQRVQFGLLSHPSKEFLPLDELAASP